MDLRLFLAPCTRSYVYNGVRPPLHPRKQQHRLLGKAPLLKRIPRILPDDTRGIR